MPLVLLSNHPVLTQPGAGLSASLAATLGGRVGHTGCTASRRLEAGVSLLRLGEDAAVHPCRTRREEVREVHDVRSEVPRSGEALGGVAREPRGCRISVVFAPAEPLRLRAPTLVRQPALDGSAPGSGRSPPRRWGCEGRGEDLGDPLEGSLPIAELRPVLRGDDRKNAVDESARQPFERAGSLHRTEGRRRRQVEAELHSRVGGVDGLTARPRRPAEPPLQLPLGHDDRASNAEGTDHQVSMPRTWGASVAVDSRALRPCVFTRPRSELTVCRVRENDGVIVFR